MLISGTYNGYLNRYNLSSFVLIEIRMDNHDCKKEIMEAIKSLGVDSFSLSGHPTNETEFLSMYKEMYKDPV